jgi:hypothetical protein
MTWTVSEDEITTATAEKFVDIIPALLRATASDRIPRINRDGDHRTGGEPSGIMADKLLDRAYNEELWVREAYNRIVGHDRYPCAWCGSCKRDAKTDRCPGTCDACKAEA